MGKKGLDDKDLKLWRYAMRDVTPLKGEKTAPTLPNAKRPIVLRDLHHEDAPALRISQQPQTDEQKTLDQHWEKQIRRGRLDIDRTLDLHGFTLERAHGILHRFVERAVREQVRVLLIITGKGKGGQGRGIIRRSVPDWLKSGPFASNIFAIRNAHPTHGGDGALYVILRRNRNQ
ncbi:MAG: Smr/MutS family protein [Sphingomonadales bacterium]|jgi:DNA-nicking Smr family endonuclease